MKNLDLCYVCTTIGNLSGVPILIFENSKNVSNFKEKSWWR